MPIVTPFKDKNNQSLTLDQFWQKVIGRFQALFLELVTGFLWWGVGNLPSHTIRKFFYRLAGMKIGPKSFIHMQARIFDPRHIQIGEGTIIGEKCTLDGRKQLPQSQGGLVIGNHVDIASDVMIWTSEHDLADAQMSAIEQKVEIQSYVFIGPRAIILPGVTIGTGAVVAAGAVVTKDVAENEVVGGVPAKTLGHRQLFEHHYRLGRPRLFQ
ncbi:MAG TPA: acyltransferase [Candidatus Woesebacteria bacterium]|nr:acyltransferase [Candidatus Woesebacteria bacterium]